MKQMKSSTKLDSLVFQLTPTRTRCDLVITANGKSEKIASGLLNPFLAHLKAAAEQIEKGGYSIVLEPKHGSDASWFTKGTVERFVRFVSSPEILERVYTIESEILQIEKSISLQNSNDYGLHNVEDLPAKSEERLEGSKYSLGCNEEKAIVLFEPTSHQSEEVAASTREKNSKAQLVQVLETRKSVLQKEQGMAFARAVAASFDADNIAALHIFAERFGASRMMDACKKYSDLWKAKHDSGQWVEVEAAEAMACRSDMPSTNAADIVFLSPSEQGQLASEKKGTSYATTTDQVQPNAQEYSPGQYPHAMYPPWQMHPQANGSPVFPPFAMQGMPYYQNYMGQSPFFQPPYSPHDDSRLHSGRKTRRRRHSMDSRDMNSGSESQEMDTSPRRKHDDVTDDEVDSMRRKSKYRGGKSKKQPGTVVVRNINYFTSDKQGSSDSDPELCSDPGTDDEKVDKTKKLKKKGVHQKSDDPLASAKEKRISGPTGDDGHWQAFQNFLLTDADENDNSAKSGMFASEGKLQGRKRQSAIRDDSSALGMHKNGEYQVGENLDIAGDATCVRKAMDEQMSICGQDPNMRYNGQKDVHLLESEGRRGAYRKPGDSSMEYVINRQENLTDVWDPSLDPVMRNGFQGTSNTNNKGSSHGMSDESFLVLQKSGASEITGDGKKTMDMDCELSVSFHKTKDHNVGPRSQNNYEPNDLNLMPNRAMENLPSNHDPAIYCEMQAQIKDTAKMSVKKEDAKGGPKKVAKDQKLKAEKRTTVSSRREKPSKFSPAEDARARAEKLRAYKADLQKLKMEKEEEQKKRIEALKAERQKRIAAKSGVNPVQSPLPSQQAKRQMPKLSPVSQKSSKFSDTEPGSCSPLQRSKLRIISKALPDSSKAAKSGNRLTRSASTMRSQKEDKTGATPDSKATMSRIRRLSEPKSTVYNISSGKTGTSEVVSRHRVSEKPELKKMPASMTVDKAKPSEVVKTRASKASAVTSQRKPTKISQMPTDKDLASSHVNADVSRDGANNLMLKNVDDNTVVEKTVVMLEREKPSVPVFHAPDDNIRVHTMPSHDYNQAAKADGNVTIPSPASPITVKEVDREVSNSVDKGQSHIGLDKTEKVPSSLPYQAPYARVSSIEDPCMAESNYGKAPPTSLDISATGVQPTKVHMSDMAAIGVPTTKVHVSDTQSSGLVKISEADSGKYQGKESSKGLKRLLFGKKNSAACERNIESDKAAADDTTAVDNASNGSSNEVFTVKNLLSHEESSSSGTTPKKPSRPFSLLSHFRSKTSEKKVAT